LRVLISTFKEYFSVIFSAEPKPVIDVIIAQC
jgi:hypothetical protein